MDYDAERISELEVLESIYPPEEYTKISDTEITVLVEPEDSSPSNHHVVRLRITYTPTYPDELPEMVIEDVEGEFSDEERDNLVEQLKQVGTESLGMAMVFTLSTSLKDSLAVLLLAQKEEAERKEADRVLKIEQAEAERTKGTPVTPASFLAWRDAFHAEQKLAKLHLTEDRLKALPPKERAAQRDWNQKPSGRELFETDDSLDVSDQAFAVDGGEEEVDRSKYVKEEREEEEDEERGGIVLSDSD